MAINSDILDYIKSKKQSFADAFPFITYRDEHWGYYFDWEGSDHHLTNYALIVNNPGGELNQIIKWAKGSNTRKVIMDKNLEHLDLTLNKVNQMGLFFRKAKKIDSPILVETGVKRYSYRSIDKDFNLKAIIETVASIEGIPEDGLIDYHRIIGGEMHLFDGMLWLLDNDGSVLSYALTSQIDNNEKYIMIDLFSTRETVQKNGHGSDLLQSILSYNKKFNFITLVKKSEGIEKLLKNYDFNELMVFDVYSQ